MNLRHLLNLTAEDIFDAHREAFVKEMDAQYPNGYVMEPRADGLAVMSPDTWRFQYISEKSDDYKSEKVRALKGRVGVEQRAVRFDEPVPVAITKSNDITALIFYTRNFPVAIVKFDADGECVDLKLNQSDRPVEAILASNATPLWRNMEGFIRWDGWEPFSIPHIEKVTPMDHGEYIDMMIGAGRVPLDPVGSETLPRFL